jgi:hypothetical protein
MTWIIYSLIGLCAQAAFIEANRKLKCDGFRLNFWASVFATLYLVSLVGFMAWPVNKIFYIVAFIAAAASSVGGVVQFYMSAKHNGRIVSMYMPVKAFAMFALWLIIDPAIIQHYISHPVETILILLAFIVSIISLVAMRKNDIGWHAFLIVAPLGALFAASNILTKIVFEGDTIISGVLCFNFLFYVFMTLQMLPVVIARKTPEKPLFDKRLIGSSAFIGLLSVLAFIGIIGGIVSAPNPAYVSVIQMMAPALIMGYHKCCGIKDDTSPVAGLGLVLSAVILIYATQF